MVYIFNKEIKHITLDLPISWTYMASCMWLMKMPLLFRGSLEMRKLRLRNHFRGCCCDFRRRCSWERGFSGFKVS